MVCGDLSEDVEATAKAPLARPFFAKKDDGRMRCEHGPVVMFQGVNPWRTPFVMNRTSQGWAGAYYTLAPKVGSVVTGGSIERNLDFPVNPE